jgi:predicted phosphodiesterase
MSYKDFRPRLSGNKKIAYDNLMRKERRVLVIGDIHAPFELEGYLEFCQETYAKYNCNQVVFIGDIIDNHYASYHETDPNGMGGGEELSYAIDDVKRWADAFPVADVCIGNHDRMIMRKAFTSAIPKEWIKDYNEVLGTNWKWADRFVYDGVQYIHGEGGTARTRAKNDMMSTVQGHIHTQSYTEWMVGRNFRVFGMQVGCGIDANAYAAAYAKHFKKQAIGCGVVLGGHTAINCLMEL